MPFLIFLSRKAKTLAKIMGSPVSKFGNIHMSTKSSMIFVAPPRTPATGCRKNGQRSIKDSKFVLLDIGQDDQLYPSDEDEEDNLPILSSIDSNTVAAIQPQSSTFCDNSDNSLDKLKYIDESSEESCTPTARKNSPPEAIEKQSASLVQEKDDELLLLDNDSGNASISDDQNSHREDDQHSASDDDVNHQTSRKWPQQIKLRKHCSTSFSFATTANNNVSTINLSNNHRFSSMNIFTTINNNNYRRYSTNADVSINNSRSILDMVNLKKSILKANCGDLIEIRCVCNCQRFGVGNQFRASINSRQKFRRSLHRQSFYHPHHHQTGINPSSTIHYKQKQQSLSFRDLFKQSCVSSASIEDLRDICSFNHDESKLLFTGTLKSKLSGSGDYCTEQFHYVFVDKVVEGTNNNNKLLLPNIWCYHVKPFQRVGLLDDGDRNVGIIRHEPLDLLVGQIMFEAEERHWQSGGIRSFKPPKLLVQCQIRNQNKFSRSVLKQTLNTTPDVDRIRTILYNNKDCYVRYNKTLLNSEHYVTLWKYGIGWSTWANNRTDILRTIQHFVDRFSQLVLINDDDAQQQSPSAVARIQLQGGECLLLDQSVNIIVQCFGLQNFKIENSIQQWIDWQVVIGNNNQIDRKTTSTNDKIASKSESDENNQQLSLELKQM